MEAVIVSTTIASVMELEGSATDPEMFKLVEVMEDIIAEPRLVRPEIFKLVDVTFVATMLVDVKSVAPRLPKKPLVEVTDVPVAVVKPNGPDRVPPVRSK